MKAKLTIDGKEREIEISQEDINKLCPKKSVVWKPKDGDKYYTSHSDGDIHSSTYYNNNITHLKRDRRGNIFQTKEEATHNDEWLQARKTLVDAWAEANDGWKPDWGNNGKNKYYLHYKHTGDDIFSMSCSCVQVSENWEYLKSREIADKFAIKYEKEWKIYKGIK